MLFPGATGVHLIINGEQAKKNSSVINKGGSVAEWLER